ncbi:hypothetical protein Lal_00035452 [Lupinus albus]|nr:hypothetical protein Lal_00035452 [Lupinus albus]
MIKREDEAFNKYVQRWVEVAAQVKLKLSMFIDTLQPPFYGMMLGCVSQGFRQLMTIGEKIESRLRSGKGLKDPTQHINHTQKHQTENKENTRKGEKETHNFFFSVSHPICQKVKHIA